MYTATGYANNDIDLGCKTIGNTEFTAVSTGYFGMPVPYTAFAYTYKRKINDINLGYITIGKTELSALTGCRRVAYAISVHTQLLGMLRKLLT